MCFAFKFQRMRINYEIVNYNMDFALNNANWIKKMFNVIFSTKFVYKNIRSN